MFESLMEILTSRDTHWFVQFMKYVVAGGISTLSDMLVFYLLAWRAIPALKEDDIAHRILPFKIKPVSEKRRARNFVINTSIAFIFSNIVAYVLNYFWVFEPGRHAIHVEIFLFYLVSLTSVGAGALLGWAQIKFMKLSTTSSYISRILVSLVINFILRKFFVFLG